MQFVTDVVQLGQEVAEVELAVLAEQFVYHEVLFVGLGEGGVNGQDRQEVLGVVLDWTEEFD